MPKVWVLDHPEATGQLNLRIGVAQNISKEFEIHNLSGMKNNEVKKHYENLFSTDRLFQNEKWPDILVVSGKVPVDQALAVKHLSGNNVFVVQIQDPLKKHNQFDLIAISDHMVTDAQRLMPNVITPYGVPHAVTKDKIDAEVKIWGNQFLGMSKPLIGVLLGGSIRDEYLFTVDDAKKMAQELSNTANNLGGSLVVTTSNRTGEEASRTFMDSTTAPAYFHDWTRNPMNQNPYHGILGIADSIVVTGDSMSMICEATMSKKPLYIYTHGEVQRPRNLSLHNALFNSGHAKPYEELTSKGIETWKYEPLQTAKVIADEVVERFKAKETAMAV